MTQTEEVRQQIRNAIERARTLRDEIRVDVHLAGLDARTKWQALEPKLADAERLAREVSETSRHAVEEIAKSFADFRASLRRHDHQPHA